MKVIRVERGWPAHFCCVSQCAFRRNTLLSCGKKHVIVSTVGNMRSGRNDEISEPIGLDRFYETMVFKAKQEGVYWEADVTEEVDFSSRWCIGEVTEDTDMRANEMHEAVVAEMMERLKKE